jgi:hypothetical protein
MLSPAAPVGALNVILILHDYVGFGKWNHTTAWKNNRVVSD